MDEPKEKAEAPMQKQQAPQKLGSATLGTALVSVEEDPTVPPGEAGIRHLLVRANLFRLRKQYNEAIECCIAAIRRRADCQAAHSMLGDIYRDQENWAEAVRWYRMAVEIRPSAVDEARLAKAEQALLQQQRALPGTIPPDPELRTGTTPLMGLPPQRWLLALWLISLGFLGGVLIMLVAMRVRPTAGIVSHATMPALPTGGFGATNFSPNYYTAPTVSPPPSQQASTISPSPIVPPNERPAKKSSAQTPPSLPLPAMPSAMQGGLPPAQVQGTAPLTVQPNQAIQPPNEAMSAPAPSSANPSLTDGFQLVNTQNMGAGVVAVFLLAPASYANDTSSTAHQALLRNIYRAAQKAFQNSYYAKATVLVEVPSQQASSPVAIARADLLRDDALALNPDTASPDSLSARMQLQFFGALSSGSTGSSSNSSNSSSE